MRRLQTVAMTMSPLLVEIIQQSVNEHVDLNIVARFDNRNFIEHLRAASPELVLVGLCPGETDEVGRRLLSVVPQARVILFSSDARHAYLHEMVPRRTALIEVSPPALIKAMRGPRRRSE